MLAAQSSSAVASPHSDGSEEPLPSKRTRRVSPVVLQVTRVTPGVSSFVLSHTPEKSDGAPGAAAPLFSTWSCTLKYFTSAFRFGPASARGLIVTSGCKLYLSLAKIKMHRWRSTLQKCIG